MSTPSPPDPAPLNPADPKLFYEIGEECWVALGHEAMQTLEKGKIVARFSLPHHVPVYYVVELENALWNHLEIRSALMMSPSPDRALGFWDARDLSFLYPNKTSSPPERTN